ncbi:MAG: ABC transporter substrate binding protein [Xanthobacteraceae bacterium]
MSGVDYFAAAHSVGEWAECSFRSLGDPLWDTSLGELALRHSVPAIFGFHQFAAAGGLASYAGSITDAYHLAGAYAGRILKGEKPADLPVQQSTKIELIFNLKSAKTLGVTIPVTLLGRADEVIE